MNAAKPLISVIMPAYNAAKFIGRAIDSVLAQTYAHWELIIVDDASTDGTEALAQSYAHPRIRYQKVPRIGHPAGVRNTGLRIAQGEFIAFLDADDLYFPETLEKMSAVLIRNPKTIAVYGFAFSMDEDENPLPPSVALIPNGNAKRGEAAYFPNPHYNHSWKNIVTSQISCLLPALMLRRNTLNEVGVLNEALYSAEDYEFYVRLFLHDYENVACLSDYAYKYRIYADSMTKAPEYCDKVLNSCLKIMRWLFEEAALPAEVRNLRSPAYTGCYHYLARERLLNGQAQLTRRILQKASKEQHIRFSDFMQKCAPLWIRSWLPTQFDQSLITFRRYFRTIRFSFQSTQQGVSTG